MTELDIRVIKLIITEQLSIKELSDICYMVDKIGVWIAHGFIDFEERDLAFKVVLALL